MEIGIATSVLIEFTEHRLPRAKSMLEKVERGEKLDEFDIRFLNEVLANSENVKPFVDRHPEYQEVYAQASGLYSQIMEKALANEKADPS